MMKKKVKRISVLDALESGQEREAAELLVHNYEITDLDAVNLTALARLGKPELLKTALLKLKPRNADESRQVPLQPPQRSGKEAG